MNEYSMNADSANNGPRTVREYSSRSSLRRPRELAKEILSDFAAGRSLAKRIFVRNLKSSYRQTLLGFVWILVPTFAQVATWSFLAGQNILRAEQIPGIPFVAFIAVGSLLWQLFFDALQAPLRIVSANQGLVTKINFPRESLILVALVEVAFEFSIRLTFVFLLCMFLGVTWQPAAGIAFMLMIALFALGLAIGLFLTPLGVLYHDVRRGIMFIAPFWMILTPVVYVSPKSEWYSIWNTINSPAGLLTVGRDLILVGNSEAWTFALPWLIAVGPLLLAALLWYRIGFPIIVERMAN